LLGQPHYVRHIVYLTIGSALDWSARSERAPARVASEARDNLRAKRANWTPQMTAATKPKERTVVADDPDDRKGRLKLIGGSDSDKWNNVLTNSTMQTLWLNHSDEAAQDKQLAVMIAGLSGIGPRDEIEGMLAAQLLACHSASMECYRRAMIGEQSFDGRKENLSQANKLSRTYSTLLEALNRHRGKGQQKVTVEHVHVHEGGQAIVGNVTHPGGGAPTKVEEQSHEAKSLAAPDGTALPSPFEANKVSVPQSSGER
jgi:hypothetical protein